MWKLRDESAPARTHRGAAAEAAPKKPLRLLEAARACLNPQDAMLKGKVALNDGVRWLPAIRDGPVEGLSWTQCLHDPAHESMLNPHRLQGESFQRLYRTGWRDRLWQGITLWYGGLFNLPEH